MSVWPTSWIPDPPAPARQFLASIGSAMVASSPWSVGGTRSSCVPPTPDGEVHGRGRGRRRGFLFRRLDRASPLIDADAQIPGLSLTVASPHPTTAGIPNSRATIEAWLSALPTSVTTAAARLKRGVQPDVVRGAPRVSPGWRRSNSLLLRITRTGPVARPGAAGAPATSDRSERLAPIARAVMARAMPT